MIHVMPGPSDDRRKEVRLDIRSVNLPFLGTRGEDHSSFQYLVLDISKSGIGFAVPNWVIEREGLSPGDVVYFHLPIVIEGSQYAQGNVLWTRWSDTMGAQLAGASLLNTMSAPHPVYINLQKDSLSVALESFAVRENPLCRILKDTAFLKKGVEIYLTHLVPFFSRIAQYPPRDYPQLKGFLFSDIRARVTEHCTALEGLYKKVETEKPDISDIINYIDLEELRKIVESEIYVDIFKATFADPNINPYLNAVKDLEKRLYINYNTIVLLYLRSL